jgi:hypothetical protein
MKTFLATITSEHLEAVSGGMRWEQLPPSKNVEDRRPAWAKQRDEEWFRGVSQPVPLPRPRPSGL